MSPPTHPPKGRDQRFTGRLRRAIEHRRLAARKAKIDRLQAALYDESLSDDEFLAARKRFDGEINKGYLVLTRLVYRHHVTLRAERRMLPRRPRRGRHRGRPGHRRSSSSSSTSSADSPGDSDGEPPSATLPVAGVAR